MAKKLLILGSGMASARLLSALDERGAEYDITVVGEEPQPGYNRILLSSILSGEKTEEDATLLTMEWYRERGVSLHIGDRAVKVDVAGQRVFTANGCELNYDRLVFATGSKAHIPDIPGVDASAVMGFRSLEDLDHIRRAAKPGCRAVVVGGGLLGLEAAHGLNTLGVSVTVVHRNGWPMNRQLDPEAGQLLQSQLEKRGIRFCMSVSPSAVETVAGSVSALALSDGSRLDADLVLFAAGIDPRAELAREAGIRCDRAIVTNEFLQTSEESIYALGECCEIAGRTFGLVAPVYEQADCLADLLCGRPTAGYRYREAPTQLKVSGIDLFSAGELPFRNETSSQYLRNPDRGIYRRLVFDGDRLVGAILLGDRSGGVWYDELIRSGKSIAGVRTRMMFGPAFSEAV